MFLNLYFWNEAHASPLSSKILSDKLDKFYLTKIHCGWIVKKNQKPYYDDDDDDEIKKYDDDDDDDDDDNENKVDDNDDDGHGDDNNGCVMGRCVYLVQKRNEHASTLESDSSRKKQKSIIAVAQANEDGYFWNEGA